MILVENWLDVLLLLGLPLFEAFYALVVVIKQVLELYHLDGEIIYN